MDKNILQILFNDFTEERVCTYKGEKYKVRDNGAILRQPLNPESPRKLDNYWTFGVKNNKTGYMQHGSHRVHIIVANAFYGPNDSKKFVVDHIDTNRCNNRKENLRWLTKLENALKNPVTRKKIEYLCGDINIFLESPSCLRDITGGYQDVMWMRTVSSEEAKNAYERVMKWAETPNHKDYVKSGNVIGEWIYKPQSKNNIQNAKSVVETYNCDTIFNITKSLTGNAIQMDWGTPMEFPLCPKEENSQSLTDYYNNLTPGKVFCSNRYIIGKVHDYTISNELNKIWVIVDNGEKSLKRWAITEIYLFDNCFAHKSLGTYFEEKGANKYFTLAQGKEWTGGDCLDDNC